jgi:HK97 family phage prohead protease
MTSNEEFLPVRPVERTYKIDDLTFRSDGSGRVVEAYAAIFRTKSEIYDQDGHYDEELDPNSFTRTIQHKGTSFGVLFNHGRTVDGTPNPMATMPIGVPEEVKVDDHGVFTATRYLNNPLADQVLDAIRNRAIKAQSFSGRMMKSRRTYPNGKGAGNRAHIMRMEIDMREYGPAVFAAYEGAAILGTRSADMFVRSLLAVKPDERVAWLQQFEGFTTPPAGESVMLEGAPNGLANLTGDTQTHSRSTGSDLAARIRAERKIRGI